MENASVKVLGVASILLLFMALGCSKVFAQVTNNRVPDDLTINDYPFVDYEEIIKSCTSILERKKPVSDAELASAYEKRGDAYYELEKYNDAHNDYERLAKLRPDDIASQWRLARSLGAIGQSDRALLELSAIIKREPKYAPAYTSFAAGMLEAKKYKECIDYASRAIAIDPFFCAAYLMRARAYYAQGRPIECVNDLDRCLSLRPSGNGTKPEMLYGLRGDALYLQGKPNEALQQYLHAYRLCPTSYPIVFRIWKSYDSLCRPTLAKRAADKMIFLDAKLATGYNCLAASLISLEEHDQARQAAETAVTLDPRNPDSYWRLGGVFFARNDYTAALSHYTRALEIDAEHRGALLSSAGIYSSSPDAKLRNGKKALEFVNRVLKGDPDDLAVLGLLAQAYAECGDFEEAVRICRALLEKAPQSWPLREAYQNCLQLFEQKKPFRFNK